MKKDKLNHLLDEKGLKKTKHRLLVLELFHKEEKLLSADDIYETARTIDHSISLSTVYRILEQFENANIIHSISLDSEKHLVYELEHKHHMHHMICTKCHKVIHIEHCPVKDFGARISKTHNFKVSYHSLEFYGVCEDCQK